MGAVMEMMRIVKEAAERRNEIRDVAERLFCTQGYDNTSTNGPCGKRG